VKEASVNWSTRHKWLAAVGLLVILLAVMALGVLYYGSTITW
jgi:hypothetical protein